MWGLRNILFKVRLKVIASVSADSLVLAENFLSLLNLNPNMVQKDTVGALSLL